MKRLLWVTDEAPGLGAGGGAIRQHHLLKALSREFDTDLLLVGALDDPDLRSSLRHVEELPSPGSLSPTRRRLATASNLARRGGPSENVLYQSARNLVRPYLADTSQYGIVHLEHERMGDLLPRQRSNVWTICLQNLISVRARQGLDYAVSRRHRWLLARDVSIALDTERRIAKEFDLTMVASPDDQAVVGAGAVVIPNGVDPEQFPYGPLTSEPTIVFTGSLDFEPNVEGLKWFALEVLPRVKTQVGGVKLLVVGRRPDERLAGVFQLAEVSGHFDVASVEPYLRRARVAVVPIRIGSGTRLKALEAMSAGLPVVGTSIGLAGLPVEDAVSAEIADSAQEMSARVTRLLTDDGYAETIRRRARSLVEDRFSWDQISARFVTEMLALV